MTLSPIVIPAVAFAVVLAHALIDRHTTIVKQKPVRHKRGVYYYCLVWFVLFWPLFYYSPESLYPIVTGLPIILFAFLTRLAFFDPLYNKFIKKGFLYEGVEKKKSDRSFFDWAEKKIGWPVWVYRIIYFVAYLGYLIFYLWN